MRSPPATDQVWLALRRPAWMVDSSQQNYLESIGAEEPSQMCGIGQSALLQSRSLFRITLQPGGSGIQLLDLE